MNTKLRLPRHLLETIHDDLSRPHRFAAERVGFLCCGAGALPDGNLLLLGQAWHKVADDDYVDDPRFGASIGGTAFRRILEVAYRESVSIFHVHRHNHVGAPRFSTTDQRSMREFVPGFFNVERLRPHGAIVLSRDAALGMVWQSPNSSPTRLVVIEVVGSPMQKWTPS